MKSKIGAHVSIAGGVDKAPQRAGDLDCETFQMFSRPPQGGPAPELKDDLVSAFKKELSRLKMSDFYIHTPYVLNLASLEKRVRMSSIEIIRKDLERGTLLGAKYIMTHIGSHTGQTLDEGLEKVKESFKTILDGYKGSTGLLIEISAGAGNVIGDTFEEIGEIIKDIKGAAGFSGICFDTCHAFASGYDFRTKEGLAEMLMQFDGYIGLEYLKLSHVNDSKTDLGGKKDRHEHIGKGYIGKEGIDNILSSGPFSSIDWILETEDDERDKDVKILQKMR